MLKVLLVGKADDLNVTLVRNHDMVHRRWCYRVRNREVNPWLWAEDKTRNQIAASARNGLQFCGSCKPLDHLPEGEEG